MRSKEVDWSGVQRVLVVRLRSIGDTVLCTPSLIALRRFLPNAQIDVLLEDWVSPLLDGFDAVDNVLRVSGDAASRLATAAEIRRRDYDIVFNLHGGTTATFFAVASGAAHRVGYKNYRYSFLYNHLLSSPDDFWKRARAHSAEQQLALLGSVGVPVADLPKTRLTVLDTALDSFKKKFIARAGKTSDELARFALFHPAAASATKEWPAENFARTAEFLAMRCLPVIAVASKNESHVLENVRSASRVPIYSFDDLDLREIIAAASEASIFIGNDSGIAHIAAAVDTPSVVIFGSSNPDHWRPWTDTPNEIVFEAFSCQPCPGNRCAVFGDPRCIQTLGTQKVFNSIDRVLKSR